jgi:hypothetical protein
MWIALAIIFVLFAAPMLLPLGMEISSEGRGLRWHVIFAGLHIPLPKRFTLWIWNLGTEKRGKKAAESPAHNWLDLAVKFRRILHSEASLAEIYRMDDLKLALDLAIRLLRILRVRVHRFKVLIASPDPAWTGIAYGWVCAAVGALPADWPVFVDVDWDSTVPQFLYRVEASVIPAQVLFALMKSLGKRYMPKFT